MTIVQAALRGVDQAGRLSCEMPKQVRHDDILFKRKMQDITAESIEEFITSHDIPLMATQTKLCIPIIFRMCQKMLHGIKFDDIKVCDNLIIDGHHRYLSALIINHKLGHVHTNSTSATEPISWDLMKFVKDDWDTPAKIDYLNELDAKYNKLEIELIKQITLK